MKVSAIKTARQKARAGAWVKGIQLDELGITIDVKARSLRNSDAVQLRGELVRALPDEQKDNMPPDVAARILAEMIAGAVVTDWSIEEPCTVDLLLDPEIGEFLRGACIYAGGQVAERGIAAFEADAKN